ncbi:MAG: hypothetical protein NTW78_05820 [Campylobacterales bacterium]|nr:hypothetical protein [Campylobacterales bacterium]
MKIKIKKLIKYKKSDSKNIFELMKEEEMSKNPFMTGCIARLLKIFIENYNVEYKLDAIKVAQYYEYLDCTDILEYKKGLRKFINSKIVILEFKRLLLDYPLKK